MSSPEAPPGAAGAAGAPATAGTDGLTIASGEWGHTSITALWVPVLVLAHAYAAIWLYRAWRLETPAKTKDDKRGATVAVGGGYGAACAARARAALGAGRGAKRAGKGASAVPQVDVETPSPAASDQAPDCEVHADGGGDVAIPVKEAEPLAPRAGAPPAPTRGGPAATLEWRGLGCSYPASSGPKVVLEDVWGAAQPGEMQALLGPSGAGKSTLMDILAMRKSLGNLTGCLLVGGARAGKGFVKRTAYVPQEDNFVPTMTAMETLTFYAEITLPSGEWSKASRRARIDEVLSEVGLSHAGGTIVGGTLPGGLMLRGLSGGERKRLSVASGILAAPGFIFLDEPTSGLDSFAALSVMGYLKRLAREHGRVVVASIHQPRSAIWQMFDAVTLLANGRLMYHGPRDGMTPWFASLGYKYDQDAHGVASDWALDLVAIGFQKADTYYGNTISTKEELAYAATAFKSRYLLSSGMSDSDSEGSGHGPRASRSGGRGARSGAPPPAADGDAGVVAVVESAAASGARAAAGAWGQFRTLLWRELLAITRNPFDVAGRTLTFAWVGVFMGILTYGTAPDAASMQSRLVTIEMTLCFYLLMPYISISLYTADKKFVLADASSKLYRPLAYYLAKVVAVTPFQIVTALVYGLTVYGMAGLRPGAVPILKNALVNTLLHLISSQVLHASAVAAPNQDVSFMISISWTAIQMLLSGFFVDFKGVYLEWITGLKYISAVYFAFQAVLVTEFEGLLLPCTGAGAPGGGSVGTLIGRMLPDTSNAQQTMLESLLKRQAASGRCTFDPSVAIEHYGVDRSFGQNVGILAGYLVVLHVITYTAMVITTRRERR